MTILGISALYHDSAAAIVSNGEIIAAAQEERFTRKKADSQIPVNAIRYCLSQSRGVDQVVYYDNPLLTLDRWLSNIVQVSPNNERLIEKSFLPLMSERLWIHGKLKEALGEAWPKDSRLIVCEHHVSHASSAFYPSPFNESAILTIDGVGEWATTTIGRGIGNKIEILKQIDYPDSLGLLYSAFTYFCGFKVNFGEYKLMGLAPYGDPIYADIIKKNIVELHQDGSFQLNQNYFTYMKDDSIIGDKFCELFGIKKREPETSLIKPYMDLAASIQAVIEEAIMNLVVEAKKMTGSDNLVMAGGTALNCVANGKIIKSKVFDKVWIQPAAGDAGGALGCALYVGYNRFHWSRTVCSDDSQKGSYLGPAFTNEEIRVFLENKNANYHYFSNNDEFYKKIAHYLCENKVVGLFHGRMEYGPRALGNRSIIANPMSEEMQSKLNLKIKFRESFRPFAPAVLEEDVHHYFDINNESSPYMLITAPVLERLRKKTEKKDDIYKTVNQKRSVIPAVTHVDYSARIQTVHKKTNRFFYKIIEEFKRISGCGVVVNTSFNVRGEPIVCTPEDAWLCFMRTDMDILVLENCVLIKDEQGSFNKNDDWRKICELD